MNTDSRRPYMLPIPMVCDPSEIENGITMEQVKKFIKKHEERFARYDYLEKLYAGFHDIFNLPEKPEWKPDHRLAVNFPRYITETFVGYGYGNPIKVTSDDESFDESLKKFSNENEMTDHNAEMATKCCIYGHAFEYLYQDEETQTRIKAFNPKELFVVYDNRLSDRALLAIRYGYYTDKDGHSKKLHGEVLTREQIQRFDENRFIETVINPYGYIPVVEWRLNEERMGLYEPVTNLVEEFNLVVSEKGNDVAAFAEAYLAILGAEVDEDGVKRIRDDRVINIYGTDDANEVLVQFLTKPTADGTQENLLDRLQDLIYTMSMVANISDESFGNATSGTALAYKLQAMSNLALTFDRKIEKSLKKRYKIFCSLSTNSASPDNWKNVVITTSRNLPKNLQEEANIARSLEGIVSKETQLKVLSIVDNPADEIDRIEDEENTRKESIIDQRMFQNTTQNNQQEASEQVNENGNE